MHPKRPNSLRLDGYDYSQRGAYFITICTDKHVQLFGVVENGVMHLNSAGRMIQKTWLDMQNGHPDLLVDCHVAMPNHFHAVFGLIDSSTVNAPGNQTRVSADVSLLIQQFKTFSVNRYIKGVKEHQWRRFDGRLWHRGFWDHIIRNDRDLEMHRDYIVNNPLKWHLDRLNPAWEGGHAGPPVQN